MNRITLILITILAALPAVLVAQGAADPYTVGDGVADFTLPAVSGADVSLSDYASEKGVIIVFLNNTCPFVKMYEDRIINLHNDYADQGFPVVGIVSNDGERSPGNSLERMKEVAEEKGYPFQYLRDADQTVLQRFGATKTPEVFILVRRGEGFHLVYAGAVDDSHRSAKRAEAYLCPRRHRRRPGG